MRIPAVALLLALSLLLLAGCGGAPQARPQRPLGLRLSDLLPQTTLDSSRTWNNAQAARRDGVRVALYNQHGRLLSYQDSFTRNVINGSGHIWLLHADSELTAFRAVSGARWYYDRLRGELQRGYVTSTNNEGANAGQTGIHVPFRRLTISPIGDERAAFTADSGGDEMGYTTRVIIFRRGRYVVLLRIRGLLDQTAVSKVVGVAREVDARLKAA